MKLPRNLKTALTLVLLLTALPAVCRADVSAAELQEAYKWFDTLGYPDVSKLPFVNVSGDFYPVPSKKRWKHRLSIRSLSTWSSLARSNSGQIFVLPLEKSGKSDT